MLSAIWNKRPKSIVFKTLGLLALLAGPGWTEPNFEKLGQEALELSQKYLRLQTINPPADTRQAADFFVKLFQAEGIPVQTFESSPGKVNVLAKLAGRSSSGRLLLINHMDVVPVDASRWPVDPFAAVIKDGFLYGRGAIDMKTIGITQALCLIALKREGVPLAQDVYFMASADEESGGDQGAQWMLQHHWQEIQPAYILDEGGFGTKDLLSAEERLVFGVSVAEKKIVWARLRAQGTSGHGSQPVLDNANDRLLQGLNRLHEWLAQRSEAGSPLLSELRQRCGPLADNKFTRAIQRDTMSLTSLRSGVGDPPKVNVIPSQAEATLDFRLLPDTEVQPFLEGLKKALSEVEGLTFEVDHFTDPTPISSHQTPLFRSIEKAILQEHPQAVVTPYLVPFGTDSNGFRQKGVQCYGLGTAIVDASIVASMHSDNERFPVAQFVPSVRSYYRCVADYAQSP